jgi:YidC/Oxa1 family membrane protein insertase
MMDYKRVALYGLLIIVLVVLFGEWERAHTTPILGTTATATASTANNSPKATQSAPTSPSAATPATNQPQNKAGQVIDVKTDMLDLSIDTNGGQIISASLPKYPVTLHSTQPFQLLDNDQATHYTAASGLSGFTKQPIVYHAASTNYQLTKGQKSLQVVLQGSTSNGLQISKIFTFHPNSYLMDVSYHITNNGSSAQTGRMYLQTNRTDIKPDEGKALRLHSFYGFATWLPPNGYQGYKFSHLAENNVNGSAKGGWLAMSQHYFLSAWIPNPNQTYQYSSQDNNGIFSFRATSPSMTIAAGKSVDLNSHFYVGPKITDRLNAAAPELSKTIDYGWLWPISILIFWLMSHIHSILGNWGWSIVLTTAIIKMIFWKPSASSYRSMAAMRGLQPKLAVLKESCGDDKQKYSREMMGLYKKEKINPVGGCLPILIQIPFFIALYWVLVASVQLRQAPFIFWIHDLAASDPYYVLPVLMGVSMFVMQKLNPPPPDPMQAKIMMMLPVFMIVLFLHFQSGLILYMLVNNLISIAQQWWIMKNYKNNPKKKEWQRTKHKK